MAGQPKLAHHPAQPCFAHLRVCVHGVWACPLGHEGVTCVGTCSGGAVVVVWMVPHRTGRAMCVTACKTCGWHHCVAAAGVPVVPVGGEVVSPAEQGDDGWELSDAC